jgi:hypothetical protein
MAGAEEARWNCLASLEMRLAAFLGWMVPLDEALCRVLMAFLKASDVISGASPMEVLAFLRACFTLVLPMLLRLLRVWLWRALFKADLWLAKGVSLWY